MNDDFKEDYIGCYNISKDRKTCHYRNINTIIFHTFAVILLSLYVYHKLYSVWFSSSHQQSGTHFENTQQSIKSFITPFPIANSINRTCLSIRKFYEFIHLYFIFNGLQRALEQEGQPLFCFSFNSVDQFLGCLVAWWHEDMHLQVKNVIFLKMDFYCFLAV